MSSSTEFHQKTFLMQFLGYNHKLTRLHIQLQLISSRNWLHTVHEVEHFT